MYYVNMEIYYCPNIKEKHNFKHFYYILSVKIPTQKEEQSLKSTKLSLKRKEGIAQ